MHGLKMELALLWTEAVLLKAFFVTRKPLPGQSSARILASSNWMKLERKYRLGDSLNHLFLDKFHGLPHLSPLAKE